MCLIENLEGASVRGMRCHVVVDVTRMMMMMVMATVMSMTTTVMMVALWREAEYSYSGEMQKVGGRLFTESRTVVG